ncbi:MAG: hypothetical protein JW797_00330 [Bradymonadales bacterium]|nr:hypothetical protein [Bradymonadales bacterium]
MRKQTVKDQLECLAASIADGIDPAELDAIRTEDDMATPEFQRVFQHIQLYAQSNPQIRYMYVMRKMPEGNWWEYVVDKDPYDLDLNGNGTIDPDEEGTPPGEEWDSSSYPAMTEALENGEPTSDDDFLLEGQWGMLLSGYARVGDRSDVGGYIVGVDSNNARLVHFRNGLVIFFAVTWLAILIVPALFFKKRGKRGKPGEPGLPGDTPAMGSSGGPRTMNPQSMTRPPEYRSMHDPYRRG